MNVVVLRGKLSRDPEARELPSGDRVLALEVTVPAESPGQRSDSVPVVWFDAPASAARLVAGTEVVVTGRARRRFFRSGGSTQSRTEVVAHRVLAASQRRRARVVLDEAAALVTAESESTR